jgi:hypothetical protein
LLIGIAILAPLSAALVQFAEGERKLAATATHERAEILLSHAIDAQEHGMQLKSRQAIAPGSCFSFPFCRPYVWVVHGFM